MQLYFPVSLYAAVASDKKRMAAAPNEATTFIVFSTRFSEIRPLSDLLIQHVKSVKSAVASLTALVNTCRKRGNVGRGVQGRSRRQASRLSVFVMTPYGRGGRGGIDRQMDELRFALANAPDADLDVTFAATRGKGPVAFSVF